MNDNELLADWLGWKIIGTASLPVRINEAHVHANAVIWDYAGRTFSSVPDFRDCSEWTGALLDKLRTVLDLEPWSRMMDDAWFKEDWRDAVIDATLEIIRRESSKEDA